MYFKNVFKKLNVPTKLSYFKITHNQVNTLYKKTILMQNSFDQNPVKFDIRKNYKILSKSIYKYARLGIDREKRKKFESNFYEIKWHYVCSWF